MASFEHRKKELRESFESQKTLMKPWEWDPISKVLETYFKLRDDALSALIEVVADDGTERRRDRYVSVLNDYAGRIGQVIGGMLNGMSDPSEAARLFREQVIVQEGLFFRSLDVPDPCSTRDMLVTLEADLIKMIADLDAKWSKISDSGRRIMDAELASTRAMQSLLDDAIRNSAPLYERLGALIAQALEALAAIPDDFNRYIVQSAKDYAQNNPGSAINEDSAKDVTEISKIGAATFAMAKSLGITAATISKALPFLARDPGMVVSDNLQAVLPKTLQMIVTVIGEMRKGLVYTLLSPYASRVAEIRDSLPFQGIVIASVSETREDVNKFMDTHGVEFARKLMAISDASFESWVSSQPQSGNHDDAVDIKLAMEQPLDRRFERLLSRLSEFVSNFGGRFFGTLSNDARKILLDPEEWDRQMGALAGMDIDQRLRVWKDTTLTVDPRLGEAWTQIQNAFAGLPADLQYGMMQRVKSVWDPLVSGIREASSGAVADIDQTARVAGSEQRRRDLDRSAALARLPA